MRGTGIVSVLGESFGPRGIGDAIAGWFVDKKFADKGNDFGLVAVADEVHAFPESESRELGGERSEEKSAGGEHLESAEVGVLRKIVTANIDDDSRAAIDVRDFL